MAYKGKVQERTIIDNTIQNGRIEWGKMIVWYIGVLISFIPIFIELLVYLKDHSTIDKIFFLQVCTKGDVLWILATLLILTVIEGCTGSITVESNISKWLLMAGAIIWGLCFAVWIVFKYIYPNDFKGNIVLWICGFMGCIVLAICSVLQLGCTEVKI